VHLTNLDTDLHPVDHAVKIRSFVRLIDACG
jgi:hypothetical protein